MRTPFTLTVASALAAAATLLVPAAPASAAGPSPAFAAPYPCGEVRDYYHHSTEVTNAIDYNIPGPADLGTPALAAAAGTVTKASDTGGGYGNEVVVDHGDGWSSQYAHLDSFSVAVGQPVGQGQEVGKVGDTGNSFGAHLHFETLADGVQQPIVVDGVAMAYDGVTRQHTSGNCGGAPPPGGMAVTTYGYGVNVRQEATTASASLGTVDAGTQFTVTCQQVGEPVDATGGSSDYWAYIPAREGFFSVAWLTHPDDSLPVPTC